MLKDIQEIKNSLMREQDVMNSKIEGKNKELIK